MSKLKAILCSLFLTLSGTALAQFQLPNGNFEKGTTASGNNTIPVNWNWFNTATGASLYTGSAAGHSYISVDASGSNHFVKITQGSYFGQQVNGNLTTGKINANSATATDASNNYNYSDPTQNIGQKFTGHPDSVAFRYAASCGSSDYIQFKVVVHGAGRYQDPEGSSDYSNLLWGKMTFNSSTTGGAFKSITKPLALGSKAASIAPAAVLISLSTNRTPGAGSAGNYVALDDVVFVYNSQLASLAVNGKSVSRFKKDEYNYTVAADYAEGGIKALSNGAAATSTVSYNAADSIATIVVKGENIAEDATNTHTYTVKFTGPSTDTDSDADVVENPEIITEPIQPEGMPTLTGKYQVPNWNFDMDWKASNEPGNGWNSYASSTGVDATFTKKDWTYVVASGYKGKAAGIKSNYVGLIASMSAWQVGYLTTGQMNIGGVTSNDSGNFNYSKITDDAHCLKFAGMPDSVEFYSRFKKGTNGSNGFAKFYLHDNFAFKDIHETDANIAAHLIAKAEVSIPETINTTTEFVRFTQSFTYTSNKMAEGPHYMLATFMTNPTPGASYGDVLDIDEVRFIYNSKLASLKVDTEAVAGFSPDVFAYHIVGEYSSGCIKAVSDGAGATVQTVYNSGTRVATITIKGSNYSVDSTNVHVYTVTFVKADISGTYYDKVDINIGGSTVSTLNNIAITNNKDKIVNVTLKNFSIMGSLLGDLTLQGVTATMNANFQTDLSSTQTVSFTSDAAKQLGLSSLPVTFSARADSTGFNGTVSFSWLGGTITAEINSTPYRWKLSKGWVKMKNGTFDSGSAPLLATLAVPGLQALDVRGIENIASTVAEPITNTLIYAKEGVTGENVVVDGVCNLVRLTTDANFNVPEAFAATKVLYDRSFFLNTAESFVMPFSFSVPDNAVVAQLAAVKGNVLNFNPVEQAEANVPYLIITKDAHPFNELSNVQFEETPDSINSVIDGVSLIGAYVSTDSLTGIFNLADNVFTYHAASGVSAFRTYLRTFAGDTNQEYVLTIGGVSTAVSAVSPAETRVDVYSLSGICLRKQVERSSALRDLPAGIYVVNGRKVVK